MTITMTHPGHRNPAAGRRAALVALTAAVAVAAYFGIQAITTNSATTNTQSAASAAVAESAPALRGVIPRGDFGSDLDWIVANGFGPAAATAGAAAVTDSYSTQIEYLNNLSLAPVAAQTSSLDGVLAEIEYLNNWRFAPTIEGCQLDYVVC